MRSTIRHVAVLAAAVVMLTAIAVPAQGAGTGGQGGGGGSGAIDRYEVEWDFEYGPELVTAWATDTDKSYRRLTIEIRGPGGIWQYESVSGVGTLLVQGNLPAPEHESERVRFFLEKRSNGKVVWMPIAEVICTVDDGYCYGSED